MQVEAVELGLTRAARGNVPEVRLVAEAPDAGAGVRTEGDAAPDGGAHETGEDGRDLGEWVSGRAVGIFRIQPCVMTSLACVMTSLDCWIESETTA